ncbi:hypothetical protein JL100_032030 (plasmid) [Skermanella mucosa]|uniref:hypothetical protein n=1 Tax=Skermanella mucosa TaxID=1789672 RepID=UPI00192B2EA5|nr:hypothetical protein [Skermanella mucosa]UEM24272.1 hypothetical protein JL100_032030 [Skermanella mucosa]
MAGEAGFSMRYFDMSSSRTPNSFRSASAAIWYIRAAMRKESWLGKSEHRDKWSFCLKAANMRAAQEKR